MAVAEQVGPPSVAEQPRQRGQRGPRRRAAVGFGEEGAAEVALRVEIDGEQSPPALLADAGKQPATMRLADAALEVEDGEDAALMAGRGRHSAGPGGGLD